MDSEFVYIFTNPCIPDWVKVGRTNCIERRLNDLDCTAVPIPFECYAYLEVPSDLVSAVENSLHKLLGRALDQKKEFFHTNADIVLEYFKSIVALNKDFNLVIAPDLETSEDKTKTQNTTFKLLGVPVGAVLTSVKDSTVSCVVADEINQVVCNGEQLSISRLACRIYGYNVNGFCKFLYEDETLWQRRKRLEL